MNLSVSVVRRKRLSSSPLRHRSFRLLIVGQFGSTVGDYCYAVGLPWYVLSLHGGTLLLGVVLACYGIPRIALIPAGGYLVDRTGSRPVMLAADVIRCLFVAVLAVLVVGHVTSWFALGGIAAVIGGGQGLFIPSSYTIMPSLVGGAELAAANSFSMASIQFGSMIGPVFGGALVAGAGPVWAFAVDAVSFALSALTLVFIGPAARGEKGAGTSPGLADLRSESAVPEREADGFQDANARPAGGAVAPGADRPRVLSLLRDSRGLQLVMVVVIAGNLAMGGLDEVAMPSLAHARFGAVGYGVMMACVAAGSVLGTLAGARTGGLSRPIIFSSEVVLVEAAAMAVAPFLGGLAGMAVALAVLGACNGLSNVVFRTVLQNWAPPRVLGGVMSLVMLCAYGSFPLSVVLTGVFVHRLGPVGFFPLAGGLVALAMVVGLAQRQFRVFGAPLGDQQSLSHAAPAVQDLHHF